MKNQIDMNTPGLDLGLPFRDDRIVVSVVGASPGVDAYDLIIAARERVRLAGGGTIRLPRIGGAGYVIRDRILIDFDNVTIEYDDNIRVTRTSGATPAAPIGVFHFIGDIVSTPKVYLKRVVLRALRDGLVLDGNGSAVTGFTYGVTEENHHVVFLRACEAPLLDNVYAYNGLMGGITLSFCPNFLTINCSASHSVWDNGIYSYNNAEHIRPFNDADPNTWCKGVHIKPRAWSCRNHGLGIFGSVGTTWFNPEWWDNGNNDGNPQGAGPAGGFGVEFANGQPTRNYRTTVIEPRGRNSFGFVFRTNCVGTKVYGGRFENALIPTNYTDDPTAPIWGTLAFAQGAATLELNGTELVGSQRTGIRAQGTPEGFPTVRQFGGLLEACSGRAVWAVGYNEVTISPTTIVRNNGDAANTTPGSILTCEFNNSVVGLNQGQGTVNLSGRFLDNQSGVAAVVGGCAMARFQQITGHNNAQAWSSAQHMIYSGGSPIQTLVAGDIMLTNTNGKAARVFKIDNATKAIVNHRTVNGDQTSALPRAEIVATTFVGEPPHTFNTVNYAPALTVNPRLNGNTNVGALTGNITINAPAGAPQSGDRYTITFVQDATGGRTITWNAAWKGATLTGAGTANQRARVTFEHDGVSYVQVSSTGWYS